MAVDPVCKMTVEPAKAAAQSTYRGQTYYFCSPECKKTFDKNPEKYVHSEGTPSAEHQHQHQHHQHN